MVEISALVIPVGGDQLIVAITRTVTPSDGTPLTAAGWLKSVPQPKPDAVLSFEIPALDPPGAALTIRPQGFELRVKIAKQ